MCKIKRVNFNCFDLHLLLDLDDIQLVNLQIYVKQLTIPKNHNEDL